MPTVWPSLILILAATLTAVPAAAAWLHRRRQVSRLRALAAAHGWTYRPGNDARLAQRLGPRLPTIGAAAVRVRDVFESAADARVVVRVDYTLGSVRSRRNCTRVVAFETNDDGGVARVQIAPLDSRRIEQFERLLAVAPDG